MHARRPHSHRFARLMCLLLCYALAAPVNPALLRPATATAATRASMSRRTKVKGAATARPANNQREKQGEMRAAEILVRFRPDASEQSIQALLESRGLRRGRQLRGRSGIEKLDLAAGLSPETAASELRPHPAVEMAEPNYLITADQMIPNDERFAEQWALRHTGQADGQAKADIGATQAWTQTAGDPQTIIAVIDSGIDFNHPDLRDNRWTNSGEQANGLDDDHNDLSDDLHGWDWVTNTNEIRDEQGHGTAVAGIIAARGNNEIGVAGVMWRAGLMSLRVLDGTGTGDVARAVEAVDYAVAHGAQVINISWGTGYESAALREALGRAAQSGALVVCSAGNDGSNIDAVPHYPASYDLPNVIAVAAADTFAQLTPSSNWGSIHVGLAAPGADILTTVPGGDYRMVTGSSFAAPFVSGVAGLIRTLRPKLDAGRTREMLLRGAKRVASLQGKVSAGVVSAAGAVGTMQTLSPGEGGDETPAENAPGNNHNRGNAGTASGNGQDARNPGRAPVRGRPSSNLPDLNVVRPLRPARPRAPMPVRSTRRNCPPRNPRCNGDGNNDQTPGPTPSPTAQSSSQTDNSYRLFDRFDRPYRSLFIAALRGEKPYSPASINVPLIDFGSDEGGYRISDSDARSGGWLAAPAAGAEVGKFAAGVSSISPFAANDAGFESQVVPAQMMAGQTYHVSVTMKNTGTEPWTAGSFYRLGAQKPQDNNPWRLDRVQLPATVEPNTKVTFSFDVTAPQTSGVYDFQWKMVQDGPAGWFGQLTNNVEVTVNAPLYEGSLDHVNCEGLSGWAWDARRPNAPIEVDIFADDIFLMRVPADQYRSDLAGKGDGRHSFSVKTPASLRDGAGHTIKARVANTTFSAAGSPSLSGSPQSIGNCSPIPGALSAPTDLRVEENSDAHIKLSWTPLAGPVSYQIVRRQRLSDNYTFLANASGNSFIDTAVSGNTAYLYRVRAVTTNGNYSPYGNVALGTTKTFFDASLEVNATPIRAQHFYDLRQTVGAVRRAAGLSEVGWTDDVLSGRVVQATHVRELRDHLNQALGALALTPSTFEDTPLAAGANGTRVRKIHVEELRLKSTRAVGAGGSTKANYDPWTGAGVSARLDFRNRTGQPGTDLLSGNFNWSLPLIELPGRSGLDLNLSLVYNSLVWAKDDSSSAVFFNADNGSPAPGFRLGFPVIQTNASSGSNNYLLVTPGGAHVELRWIASNTYESADSSYLRLETNGNSMLLRSTDGMQMTFVLNPGDEEYHCTQVKDRNGNFISVAYDHLGGIQTITDTLGRVLTFNYDAFHNLLSITQARNGGTHEWATFGYATQSIQGDFSGLTVHGPQNGQSINVLTQVGLADGSRYQFDYNSYGQVSKLSRYSADNHQLAYMGYDYSPTASDWPRVSARRDWALDWNNGAEAATTFSYASDRSWGQMTAPDGTIYKEMFDTGQQAAWKKGLTTQTESWAGGARHKHTVTEWTQDDEALSYQLNPRPKESHIYDKEGNHKRTAISYTSYGLPSDIREYAADAESVLRRTHIDYRLDAAYVERRIIGLPGARYVYEGESTLVAKIDFHYDWGDEYFSIEAPSVQHDGVGYGAGLIYGRGNLSAVRRFNKDAPDHTNQAHTDQAVWQQLRGYNAAGSLFFTRDGSWHTTRISYADAFLNDNNLDGNNARNTLAYPTTVTDGDNYSSKVKYNYDLGVVRRSEDPKGAASLTAYDGAGRVERVTNLVNNAYTRFVYAPDQNWVQTFTTVRDTQTESYSIQVFDGAGRVYASAGDFPGGAAPYRGQHTVYDVMGRAVRSSNPAAMTNAWEPVDEDTADNLPAGWYYATQDYDWRGRPTFSTNADGGFKQELVYGGCGCAGGEVVTVRDAMGRRQRMTADVLGRTWKTEVLNPNGSPYRTTTNLYNARDQITRARVNHGAETSGTYQDTILDYDGHGRLASSKSPIQLYPTGYVYNNDDTVREATDARGVKTTFTYNARDLVTKVTYDRGSDETISPAANVNFVYDAAGNRLSMTEEGTGGSVAYVYDQLSRLTSEARQFPGLAGTYTLAYEYALSGALRKVTDERAGTSFSYAYDQAGQLTGVTGTGLGEVGQLASNLQYRASGALKGMNYGNGASVSLAYDARGLVTRYVAGGIKDAAGQPLPEGGDFLYYADGRVKYGSDFFGRGGTSTSVFDRAYRYDVAGRLEEAYTGTEARDFINGINTGVADGPYRQLYAHDAWDNQMNRTGRLWSQSDAVAATYNAQNRNQQWSYDAAGNLLSMNEAPDYSLQPYQAPQHRYDAAGRHVSLNSTHTRYSNSYASTFVTTNTQTYDGDSQVVRSTEQQTQSGFLNKNITSYYLRSSVLGGRTVTEYDAAGARHISYTYAGSGVLTETTKTYNDAPWQQWRHTNPVTGDAVNTDTQGKQTGLTRLDPAGTNVGESDPFIDTGGGGGGESPAEADRVGLVPIGAGWGGSGSGSSAMRCNLDGVEVGCGWVMQMMDIGAAERCPNNDCGPHVQTVTARDGEGRVIGSSSRIILPGQPGWDGSFDGNYRRGERRGDDRVLWWGDRLFNRVSGGSRGTGLFGFASFFAPQNSGFRFGNVAFSEEQQKILAQSFSRINQDNCKGFINRTLAAHGVGADLNSLEKLLNRAKFNFYDTSKDALIGESYSPGELGLDSEGAILVSAEFMGGASAVTAPDRVNVFLSSIVFDRPLSRSIPVPGYNRYADTATYIVHELFHVAGIKPSIVDSQKLTKDIRENCRLTGSDPITLKH